ncbi:MAG: NAD(P)/FAD-dependent oxidoreductase, partial [Polyangiaceae bacterium]|nr:NAD(P)/FAD-dependent oxidoreductase [Polyangiaceae bacterium]
LLRRDPHYFLPTLDRGYVLFGADAEATRSMIHGFFSGEDARADARLAEELAAFRADVGPTWLEEPLSIEETAERCVRPAMREPFIALCRGSVGDYLDRFGFRSDLLKAMYAVTDGFTGLYGSYRTKGTGMNFLIHNMCRLPGSDGTWMIVRGGMGTVTSRLAELAEAAGARIDVGRPVTAVETHGGAARGVVLADGERIDAEVVVLGSDPFSGLALLGEAAPLAYRDRVRSYERDGTTFKLNMALRSLPRFTCLPEDRGQHRGTIHILPQQDDVISSLERAFAEVEAGRLPESPAIEWYIHTPVDPSLADPEGRHSAALFVQWVPYRLADGDWETQRERYARHLLSICDRFAPGTSELVEDTFALAPPDIERHFGMHRGHIHHVDNRFGFDDRLPYRIPIDGLYNCGAGCHPGGSVIGAAGYNAARAVLRDLGRPSAV